MVGGFLVFAGTALADQQIPVFAITVTGTGSATSILPDSALQMIATVSPSDASDMAVTWSVQPHRK